MKKMAENVDTLTKMRKAFEPTLDTLKRLEKAEEFYWLYRTAKENPQGLEVAFLREANRLQKISIDELLDGSEVKLKND
jgi:hypothetical protein